MVDGLIMFFEVQDLQCVSLATEPGVHAGDKFIELLFEYVLYVNAIYVFW